MALGDGRSALFVFGLQWSQPSKNGEQAIEIEDLEVLRNAPIRCWVKDKEWRDIWGNNAISKLAGETVTGKTGNDLVWSTNSSALVQHDQEVVDSGEPHSMHETVDHSDHGKAVLNVCKWVDGLDGERCVNGISVVIPG